MREIWLFLKPVLYYDLQYMHAYLHLIYTNVQLIISVKDIEDIDFTTSTSSLSAHWTGFFHVYLDVDFKFRAGTKPGDGDVFPQADVGRNQTYTAKGLALENFKVI